MERRLLFRFTFLFALGLCLSLLLASASVHAAPMSSLSPGSTSANTIIDTSHRAPSNETTIADLPALVQGAISAGIGREEARYHAAPVAGGYRLHNPHHSLTAFATSQGVMIRAGDQEWRLVLAAWGYGDERHSLAATGSYADANRIEYRHDSVTEWYTNGPMGLQQGFTIAAPPAGTSRVVGALDWLPDGLTHLPRPYLTLALEVGDGVQARVDPDRRGLMLTTPDGTATARYNRLTAYDASERALPVWLKMHDGQPLLQVDDSDAQYPLHVDLWFERAQLLNSYDPPPGGSDHFGADLSIDGDTIVISAYFARNITGNVYVFEKPRDGWTSGAETATLTASDASNLEAVGVSLDIDGDTIVAGARDNIGSNEDQGSVYVFVKPPEGWRDSTETAKLTASDGTEGDFLGHSVAISGDTIVAGAEGATIGENVEQGAAYVFVKPEGGWQSGTETAKLVASDGAAGDQFGEPNAVDIDDNTIVVGAPFHTLRAEEEGAIYVFVRSPFGWQSGTESARLRASDGAASAWLGSSVAIDGDAIVAGANGATIGAHAGEGAAYVFVKPPFGWRNRTETGKLTASNGDEGDGIGYSVAINGDTIVVGAKHNEDGWTNDRGAAYVFVMVGDGWTDMTESAELEPSDIIDRYHFGEDVAVEGNIVLAGAPDRDLAGGDPLSKAYLFVQPLMAIEYQVRWNDGEHDAGTAYYFTGGSFEDSDGFEGEWTFGPIERKLYMQYAGEPCNAFVVGNVRPPGVVLGSIFCRNGSDRTGIWSGRIEFGDDVVGLD